jgi:hypothetical protein
MQISYGSELENAETGMDLSDRFLRLSVVRRVGLLQFKYGH